MICGKCRFWKKYDKKRVGFCSQEYCIKHEHGSCLKFRQRIKMRFFDFIRGMKREHRRQIWFDYYIHDRKGGSEVTDQFRHMWT